MNTFEYVNTAHAWHLQVGNDQVDGSVLNRIHRRASAGAELRDVTLRFQNAFQPFPDDLFVISYNFV